MDSKHVAGSFIEDLNCPVCLDLFTDPVILQCGHTFCRPCVTRGTNSCPECREEFADRNLRVNRALASLAEKARKSNLNGKEKESELHCEEHGEELKLFCETDKKLICVMCLAGRDPPSHDSHRFLLIEEAVDICKDQLKSSLDSLTEKKTVALETELKQKQQISEVGEQSSSLQAHITSEFATMHQILTEKEQRLISDLREQEERIINTMEKNLREIQENVNSIEQVHSELQIQADQQDGLMFLKEEAYRERRISEVCNGVSLAGGNLSLGMFKGPLQYMVWKEMIDNISPVPASLTLDPKTAHCQLILSKDGRRVRTAKKWKHLPHSLERFNNWLCVLGSEGFTSGKHYWEVQVRQKTEWDVGVARESIDRSGYEVVTPESGYWMVWLRNGNEYKALTSPSTRLTPRVKPLKIGVYLDYEGGQVSFYDADNMSHLHTFTDTFTERLYPYFSPCLHEGGKNMQALRISWLGAQ